MKSVHLKGISWSSLLFVFWLTLWRSLGACKPISCWIKLN